MTLTPGRPDNFRPDNSRPTNFRPDTTAAGYHVISQPTADVDAVKTTLSIEPPGTTSYLLTGTPDSVRWVYIRVVSACGEDDGEPVRPKLRRVAFDAAGDLIPDVPNAPGGLTLTPGGGGTINAVWNYIKRGQMAAPTSFNVYTATGENPFDYNTPAGNVAAPGGGGGGGGGGTFTTGAFAHGTTVRVVVRAVSAAGKASGGEEPNTIEVSAVADAQAPDAPDDLVVELIE